MKTTTTTVYDIYFDQSLDAVIMEWTGYATSAQFREGTELMLNLMIQHKSTRVLAAIQNMVLIGLEDQNWLTGVFLPRAVKFGLKTAAIIKPESYFNKVALENVSHRIDQRVLSVSFFDNLEDARGWLKTDHTPNNN